MLQSFSRADPQSAARTFVKIFPDEAGRRLAIEILATSIAAAHQIDAQNWGVTLEARAIRFNVGRGAALAFSARRLSFTLDHRALADETCALLRREARLENGFSRLAPHATRATFEAEQLVELWPLIERAHLDFVAQAARGFASRAPRPTTIRDAHSGGVLMFLRVELGREIPDPASVIAPPDLEIEPVFDASHLLNRAMQNAGLQFPTRHLAAFFTALSTKGLVILSGPSGVGKTALALRCAALLPAPGEVPGEVIRLEKAHGEAGLPLPVAALRYLSLPRAGESRAATLVCDGAAHPIQLVGTSQGARLRLRGAARKWCAAHEGEDFALESDFESENARPTFRLLRAPQLPAQSADNHLFLPVRPDWRDEKPLLGYFNPLQNRYQWTPFLRFLLRADAGFARGDGLAYFVILDEMNLARAEWYFADFLSILEAGRDENGRTREPIRFDFDARATGELPPRELYLPPNLYFIGTINADESAPALSPKILDRAWVLEAPRADFRADTAQKAGEKPVSEVQKRRLLALFTRDGRFATPDKALVAAQLEKFPARREDLAILGEVLEPLGAGFGFRVFDEILAFCALALQNELFEGEKDAFDCAVSLKIASRFRGARGALDEALGAFLGWSQARNFNQSAEVAQKLIERLERDGFLP